MDDPIEKPYIKCHVRIGKDEARQITLNMSKTTLDNPQFQYMHFDVKVAKVEFANMIILCEYPLSMVDHEGFKRYSHSLQPLFKVALRNTISNDILKIYEVKKREDYRDVRE